MSDSQSLCNMLSHITPDLLYPILQSIKFPKMYVKHVFGEHDAEVYGHIITTTEQLRSLLTSPCSFHLLDYLYKANRNICDPVLEDLIITQIINNHLDKLHMFTCIKIIMRLIIEQDNVKAFKQLDRGCFYDLTKYAMIIKDTKIYTYLYDRQDNYHIPYYTQSLTLFPDLFMRFINQNSYQYAPFMYVDDLFNVKAFDIIDRIAEYHTSICHAPAVKNIRFQLSVEHAADMDYIIYLMSRGHLSYNTIINKQIMYSPDVLNWLDNEPIDWTSITFIPYDHDIRVMQWLSQHGVQIQSNYMTISLRNWKEYHIADELAPNDLSREFIPKMNHLHQRDIPALGELLEYLFNNNVNIGMNSFIDYINIRSHINNDIDIIFIKIFKPDISIIREHVGIIRDEQHIVTIKNMYPELWGNVLTSL